MTSSESLDISTFFASFDPEPKRLRQIALLLRGGYVWWHFDGHHLTERIALLVAPGNLSQLTPVAVHLLGRCQKRVWAFQISPSERYGISRRTYGALFSDLLDLGLIVEADERSKLRGSQTVDQLRELLGRLGLSRKGNKDALVDRAIEHLSSGELQALVAEVVLYRTTKSGDDAIKLIQELNEKVRPSINGALIANHDWPPLPEHVPSDMAEFFSDEEWQEIRALQTHPPDYNSMASVSELHYDHSRGPDNLKPGWNQSGDSQMTADQRRAIIIDRLVALSNLTTPGFVIFSDQAKPDHYVQLTPEYCEVTSLLWGEGKGLTLDQEQAILALGFAPPNEQPDNYWMDCSDKSVIEMAAIVEDAFRVIGSAPDFGLEVEFDDGT